MTNKTEVLGIKAPAVDPAFGLKNGFEIERLPLGLQPEEMEVLQKLTLHVNKWGAMDLTLNYTEALLAIRFIEKLSDAIVISAADLKARDAKAELRDRYIAVLEAQLSDVLESNESLRRDAEQRSARLQLLEMHSHLLAVHVNGHFALPSENSRLVCLQWAEATQRVLDDNTAMRGDKSNG